MLQEFVVPKTRKASVYRFYRNERNVIKAECISNKRSLLDDNNASEAFRLIQQENNVRRKMLSQGGQQEKLNLKDVVDNALEMTQNRVEQTLQAMPFDFKDLLTGNPLQQKS